MSLFEQIYKYININHLTYIIINYMIPCDAIYFEPLDECNRNYDTIAIDKPTNRYENNDVIDNITFTIHNKSYTLTTTGKIYHMNHCDDTRCICCWGSIAGPRIKINWNGDIKDHIVALYHIQNEDPDDSEYRITYEIICNIGVYRIIIDSRYDKYGHGNGNIEWYLDGRLINHTVELR
jgi:hypothetical protein